MKSPGGRKRKVKHMSTGVIGNPEDITRFKIEDGVEDVNEGRVNDSLLSRFRDGWERRKQAR